MNALGHRRESSFPATLRAVRDARRFVLDHASAPSSVEDEVALLVSELVSNAVLHAKTPLRVVVDRHDDVLRVEVHDRNPRMPFRKRHSELAPTGRGTLILDAVAERWGSEAVEDGKVVWFELLLAPEET